MMEEPMAGCSWYRAVSSERCFECRYQPSTKSSQNKLPAPKQVTIVEDLSSKLAAAVSGDSEPETPVATAVASQDHSKLVASDRDTAKRTAQHAAQKEDEESPRSAPCLLYTSPSPRD